MRNRRDYFSEGSNAFLKGQVGSPHPLDSNAHREWERGFNKAYFKNLEEVKRHEQETRTGSE